MRRENFVESINQFFFLSVFVVILFLNSYIPYNYYFQNNINNMINSQLDVNLLKNIDSLQEVRNFVFRTYPSFFAITNNNSTIIYDYKNNVIKNTYLVTTKRSSIRQSNKSKIRWYQDISPLYIPHENTSAYLTNE